MNLVISLKDGKDHLEKPLLVYDGYCEFCIKWISLWRETTAGSLDYETSQNIGDRFLEIPPSQYEDSVVLVLPTGVFCTGAEAVFRTLALSPQFPLGQALLQAYFKIPGFKKVSEGIYAFVAKHRSLFAFLTRILFGANLARSSYSLSRWIFLRFLGVLFLFSFLLFQFEHPHSSQMVSLFVEYGSFASALLMFDFFPVLSLAMAWGLTFALNQKGGGVTWLVHKQGLFFEIGLLGIFFAPPNLLPQSPLRLERQRLPSFSIRIFLRWLLIGTLIFSEGVKPLRGASLNDDFIVFGFEIFVLSLLLLDDVFWISILSERWGYKSFRKILPSKIGEPSWKRSMNYGVCTSIILVDLVRFVGKFYNAH